MNLAHLTPAFLEAFLIGFAIAAPIGPIGLLCIRKTLERGFIGGALSVGLGASIGDAIYGFVAGAGLTTISAWLVSYNEMIKLFGGGLLLYIGVKEILNPDSTEGLKTTAKTFFALTAQTILLTLANPMTIISFVAVFASVVGPDLSSAECGAMVIGIFWGAMAWWIILGRIVVTTHKFLSARWIRGIRQVSGVFLSGFALWAIGSAVLTFM